MAQLTSYLTVLRVFNGNVVTAAGSSAVDGVATNSVDMSGYDGCMFIGHVTQGGTSGTISLSIRQTTAAIAALTSGGQGTTLVGTTSTIAAGSSATAEAFVIDVYRPRQSYGLYLHGQWTVASSCATLGPIFALPYQPRASAESTALDAVSPPQSTAASSFAAAANSTLSGITGGVVRAVSPST
jgi:hypothetical protein